MLEEIHIIEEVIVPCIPAKHPECFAAKWVSLLLREVLHQLENFESNCLKYRGSLVWETQLCSCDFFFSILGLYP